MLRKQKPVLKSLVRGDTIKKKTPENKKLPMNSIKQLNNSNLQYIRLVNLKSLSHHPMMFISADDNLRQELEFYKLLYRSKCEAYDAIKEELDAIRVLIEDAE